MTCSSLKTARRGSAVILLLIVLLIAASTFRLLDVRKELER